MKKNKTNLLILAFFLIVSMVSLSCKKDDLDSITLKRSGNLSITLLNGEEPIAGQKVELYNYETSNYIDVLLTDEKGVIDFGQFNDGIYEIYLEIKAPKYQIIEQEIHVISGEAINKTIQVANYIGSVKMDLRDIDNGELVKEDVGLGVAFVPRSDAFDRVNTHEERIALATEIKYFGSQGQLAVDLPIARYNIYLVRNGVYISTIRTSYYIYRFDEHYLRHNINVADERLANSL